MKTYTEKTVTFYMSDKDMADLQRYIDHSNQFAISIGEKPTTTLDLAIQVLFLNGLDAAIEQINKQEVK